MNYVEFSKEHGGQSHTKNPNMDEKEAFAFNSEWVNGYFTEDQWSKYKKTVPIECHVNNDIPECKDNGTFYIYDSMEVLKTFCAPVNPKASLLFNKVTFKMNQGVIFDLQDAYHLFGFTALIALGSSIVLMILICLCTKLITWILIIMAVLTLFGFAAVMLIAEYAPGKLNDGVNAARVRYLSFLIRNKFQITALAIGCIVLGVILVIVFITSAKTLNKTTPLISVAFKSSLKNILLII